MMVQDGEYQYFETDTLQAIALLYGNAHFQMYVLLPRSKGGLADLMRSLDESHWREWTNKLSFREGEIVLPKFETTYAKQLNERSSIWEWRSHSTREKRISRSSISLLLVFMSATSSIRPTSRSMKKAPKRRCHQRRY